MFTTTRPALSSETLHCGVQLVTLDGEFDISHTPQIGYRLSDIVGACEGRIVVDLRGVSFLDSKMVGTLVRVFRQAEHRGCRLALVRPNPHVWRVFEVGGVSEMFLSFGELRDALGNLPAPA
jgi:anti-sigma B factor antagonist